MSYNKYCKIYVNRQLPFTRDQNSSQKNSNILLLFTYEFFIDFIFTNNMIKFYKQLL